MKHDGMQIGITFCFFLSGIAGLMYQVVWMRYMALFLGQTSQAVVLVLMTFLGGLALGNAWLGGLADRVRSPLRYYSWLELAIGVCGITFPVFYIEVRSGFESLAQGLAPGSLALGAFRFLAAACCMLLPTALMGATLPALTRFATHSINQLAEKVAWLYFVNSAGAVVGCAIAEFWFIPSYGLHPTVIGAGCINLLVAIIGFGFARRLAGQSSLGTPDASAAADSTALPAGISSGEMTQESRPSGAPQAERCFRRRLRLCLFASFISGFAALLYEVAWTRILALSMGSTHQAFSIMLMTMIAGIAIGAAIVHQRRYFRDVTSAFGKAELALAVLIVASMFFYERIGFGFARFALVLNRTPEAFPLYQGLQGLVCLMIMLPPAICLGMTLPMASRIATETIGETGRSVGRVFAFNTFGTVVGAAVTGWILLPMAGLAGTMGLGVALNAFIGVLLLRHATSELKWLHGIGALAAGLIGMMIGSQAFGSAWANALGYALWRYDSPPRTWAEFKASAGQYQTLYHRDGAGATVSVARFPSGGTNHLALRINGKVDASTLADVPTQLLCGHLPMLLHSDPKRVLVIGLGSGMTAGALTCHSSLERADVMEISPEVVAAAKLFGAHNREVLEDQRIRLILEDAKTYFALERGQYDVIISEPSHPWLAGMAGLFSEEFYRICATRLRPGGIMLQWIHFHESDDATLNIVFSTFTSVFGHTSVWRASERDLLLVALPAKQAIDLERVAARFRQPQVAGDLQRAAITGLPVMLALEVISPLNTAYLAPSGTPRHHDFVPILESAAQRALFLRQRASAWRAIDERRSTRPATLLGQWLGSHRLDADDCEAIALAAVEQGLVEPDYLRPVVELWRQLVPESLLPIEIQLWQTNPPPPEVTRARAADESARGVWNSKLGDASVLRRYAAIALDGYRSSRSAFAVPSQDNLINALGRLVEIDSKRSDLHRLRLAELAWDRGDDREFLALTVLGLGEDWSRLDGEALREDSVSVGEVLWRAIESKQRAGDNAGARLMARRVVAAGIVLTPRSEVRLRLDVAVRRALGGESNAGTRRK